VRLLEEARDVDYAHKAVTDWLERRGYLAAGVYPPP
jgi:transposase